MAPESLSKQQYSEKSDVWSFGVVCWEILNRSEPYPGMLALITSVKVLTENLKPDLPNPEEFPILHGIMKQIFSWNPEDRPNFEEIYRQLTREEVDTANPLDEQTASGYMAIQQYPRRVYWRFYWKQLPDDSIGNCTA
jgi:serine/threonine protein kinase